MLLHRPGKKYQSPYISVATERLPAIGNPHHLGTFSLKNHQIPQGIRGSYLGLPGIAV